MLRSEDKPRIYWAFYPKLGRGYWRVRRIPQWASKDMRRAWKLAYAMAQQMNRGITDAADM